MRLLVSVLVLCAVSCSISYPAYAKKTRALISGAYLLELCKRDAKGQEQVAGAHIACQSYVAGVVDYHNLLRSLGTSPNVDLCVPVDAKLNDLQDIVWDYLNKNKHHHAFIAAPAVNLALFEKFPCQKSKKKK